jgi:hypothetical protein
VLHTTRRRVAAGAVVSCALLVGAAPVPASAKVKIPKVPKVAAYNVEFEGSGSYDVNGTDANGGTTTVKATFKWDAKYRKLIFIRSAGSDISTVIDPKKSSASGTWSISAVTTDGEDDCATSGQLGLSTGGGVEGRVQGSGKAIFKVYIGTPGFATSGGDGGTTACSTSDFWHDWPTSFSHIGNGDVGDDVDPITGFSILDGSDFNHGKIVDNLSNVTPKAPNLVVNPNCGGDASTSCAQDFSWTGHLTLTKTHV